MGIAILTVELRINQEITKPPASKYSAETKLIQANTINLHQHVEALTLPINVSRCNLGFNCTLVAGEPANGRGAKPTQSF